MSEIDDFDDLPEEERRSVVMLLFRCANEEKIYSNRSGVDLVAFRHSRALRLAAKKLEGRK